MPDAPALDVLRADAVLGPVVQAHGPLRLVPAEDPFRRLITSIVGQQLSTTAARAIRERLFEAFVIAPGPLLEADAASLRALGLSRRKAEYVHSAAEAFERGPLRPAALPAMTDGEVVAELTAIRGVGIWTAKMFLMFALARPDVFPVEDLGIRAGMEHLCGPMTRPQMRRTAERWRPYRSTASLYLWRAADG